MLVKETMKKDVLVTYAEETLDEALEELTTNHRSWAPVVESRTSSQKYSVIGIISMVHIMQLYREAQAKDSHRMQNLVKETTLHI